MSGLDGSVTIRPSTVGTAFELRIPVRLAATDVVLVHASGEAFAVSLDGVRETLFVSPDRIRAVSEQPSFLHHGRGVPLVRLADAIGFPATDGAGTTRRGCPARR